MCAEPLSYQGSSNWRVDEVGVASLSRSILRSWLPSIRRCDELRGREDHVVGDAGASFAIIDGIESKFDSRTFTPYRFSNFLTSAGSMYSAQLK